MEDSNSNGDSQHAPKKPTEHNPLSSSPTAKQEGFGRAAFHCVCWSPYCSFSDVTDLLACFFQEWSFAFNGPSARIKKIQMLKSA